MRDGPLRHEPPPLRRLLADILLLIVAVAAVFHPLVFADFSGLDDGAYVLHNTWVNKGLTLEGLRWALTGTDDSRLWHPVTWVSHMLDVQWFDLWAGGHHLSSVALHAANAVLLYLFFALATGERGKSLFVAALFALHPLHVEPVAWIAERKGLVYTFFWTLGMLAHLRYARRPGLLRYLPVTAACALSLASKPLAVTFPFALLLLDYWPLQRLALPQGAGSLGDWLRRHRLVLSEKLPLLGLSLASGFWILWASRGFRAKDAWTSVPLASRLADGLASLGHYMVDLFLPLGLSPFYPRPEEGQSFVVLAFSGIAVLALCAISVRTARQRPALFFGWFWFLVTLGPVLGFLPIGGHDRADRYTYVALTGLFVPLAWATPPLSPRLRRMVLGVGIAFVAVLGFAAHRQVAVWKNGVTLFTHALNVTRDNPLSRLALGWAKNREGDVDGAIHDYARALELAPSYQKVSLNLAGNLLMRQRTHEGLEVVLKSLATSSELGPGALEKAQTLWSRGDPDGAAAELARTLPPAFIEEVYLVGLYLMNRGKLPEAQAIFTRVARQDPEHPAARNSLGWVLFLQGRMREAERAYREAIALSPGFAVARNNLGIALAEQGRLEEAEREMEESVRLSPRNPSLRENLEKLRALMRR